MSENTQLQLPGDFHVEIRRAPLGRLTVYDVTETELEILERGAPDSVFLNTAIFLLSSALSLVVALLTTESKSLYIFLAFVSFVFIGLIAGGVLLLLWRRGRVSVSACAKIIRGRLPPEGIQQPLPPTDEGGNV